MPRKNLPKHMPADPQKSSAAQFLTYIASTGAGGEKYEIRYEDENIWMSQKMLAAVYGVEIPNVAYHLRKIFEDAELDEGRCIKEILIDLPDGRKFKVKHYGSLPPFKTRCIGLSTGFPPHKSSIHGPMPKKSTWD